MDIDIDIDIDINDIVICQRLKITVNNGGVN